MKKKDKSPCLLHFFLYFCRKCDEHNCQDMQQPDFKYFAFISYNSKDTEWGKRVQHKLEHYRMPATLCSEHGWKRVPINPVFFAPSDIQGGGLSAELQSRLQASRNLIVICSPNSAKSEWVGREIAYFHSLGRTQQIHFFIVDGIPHSDNPDTECFNPIVKKLGLPEILGANIHEQTQTYPFTHIPWARMNRERAYVQLITKLLGVEFDSIWQRHKRLLIQQVVAWAVGIITVLAALTGVWIANQPVDVSLSLDEQTVHNAQLPPLRDAVVTMTLDNETKTDTLHALTDAVLFKNIPHSFLANKVRVCVEAPDFLHVDTTVVLTRQLTIPVARNSQVYGYVRFKLWNPDTERTAANTPILVDGHQAESDANGVVTLSIPLAEQKTAYPVSSSVIQLVDETVYPPFGPDDIVQFK